MMEYYDILQETHKEWEDDFKDFIEELRDRGVCHSFRLQGFPK